MQSYRPRQDGTHRLRGSRFDKGKGPAVGGHRVVRHRRQRPETATADQATNLIILYLLLESERVAIGPESLIAIIHICGCSAIADFGKREILRERSTTTTTKEPSTKLPADYLSKGAV